MLLGISCNEGPLGGRVTPGKRPFCRFYSSCLEQFNRDKRLKGLLEVEDTTELTMEYLAQVTRLVNVATNIDPDFQYRVARANKQRLLSTYDILHEIPEWLWIDLANLSHYKEALQIICRERGIVTTNQEEFSEEGVTVQLLVGIYNFNCPSAVIEANKPNGLSYLTENFPMRSKAVVPVNPDEDLAQMLLVSPDGMFVQDGEKPGTAVVYVRLTNVEFHGKIKRYRTTPIDIRKVHPSFLDP